MTTARTEALLALLQVCDSLFPSGSFTHSYGLETLVRERIVRTPAQLESFVASVLRGGVLTSDAVAASRTHRAAIAWQAGNLAIGQGPSLEEIVAIDRALLRFKAAPELRQAALATGRRLVEETAPHLHSPLLDEYAATIRADATPGLHPVAFGVVSAVLGVGVWDVSPALLQTSASAILQAAMRLLPVSHRDVQAILHRLRPQIAELASHSDVHAGEQKLSCFHPLQEIASLRHARAEARLFAS